MKIFIQFGDFRGVESEFKRIIKPDREYTIELKETKRSKNKRKRHDLQNKLPIRQKENS